MSPLKVKTSILTPFQKLLKAHLEEGNTTTRSNGSSLKAPNRRS